jgi:short subunit dehydrogenase-like uncharacterized protein
MDPILIYGANGYTGELIARYANDFQLKPVIAGRRKDAIEPLAKKLGLQFLVFDLDDSSALIDRFSKFKLIINCAGPFQFTAKQVIEACLKTHTHYIDINGDVSVFEMIKTYDAAAKKAGIMLLPGAGFDVVPTDCLGLKLKKFLPDANFLQLAFATIGGSISHGTATTVANKLGEGGIVRKDGKIIKKKLGHKGMWIQCGEERFFVMTIPWGDISTSYVTTGIPNIETYVQVPKRFYYLLKIQFAFNWLLRKNFIRNYVKRKINRRPAGPSDEQRSKAYTLVWGKVMNDKGNEVSTYIKVADGYTLTYHSCLVIAKKILNGNFKTGYQTPGTAYTETLLNEFPYPLLPG